MKKKLISLLLVFSFLLNTVPMAFAIEDGAEQTEDTTVSLVGQIGEDDANTEGDTDVAAPETTGEEQTDGADGSEDTDAAEAGDEGDDEAQTNVLMTLASQPAARSTVTLGSAAAAAGLTPVVQTHHAIANGVTYDKIVMRNKDNHQAIGYMTEIDLTKNVTLKATYDGYYTAGSTAADRVGNAQTISKGQWSLKETTRLAADYGKIADPAGTVVMATNGDYFNMGTGEPTGYLIMEGNVIKTSYEPYFAILTDGTAVIRDAGTPTDDVMEAVSGPLYLLRNGEIQVTSDGSMNPRNSVGIRADGSVVFFMAEGRLAPRSIGMDLYEMAAVLKDAGCVTALYLDGGGSATFAAREEGGELKMLSKPSDGQERTISSGMICVSTESQDGVFDHALVTPRDELYTPGSAVQFGAVGVDRSGGAAELPEGLVWKLAEDSAALGTIDPATGLFAAGADSVGVVTVALCQGDDVVGTASVELVKPDTVTFNSDEISLDFDEESDLGLVVRYQNRDVNYKDGDIQWTLADPKMGAFTGNTFRSADGYSVTANITATSAFDETVTGTIKAVIGMLPTVVWDFEDHVNEDGTVVSAKTYYESAMRCTFSGNEANTAGSFEIVSIDDGEPVRFGSHSLKMNYDFTRVSGGKTDGVYIGLPESEDIPGTPTALGVWVYAPEGVGVEYDGKTAGFWLRGYAYDVNGNTVTVDFTLQPKDPRVVSGEREPGIYWSGWKYLEADITNFPGPYKTFPNQTFRLMYVPGIHMGSQTAGCIYLDNFQFVYGTNVDDVDNPQVDSITFNNEELMDGGTVRGSTFDLRAYFSDAPGKYATGVDADTVRLYVDGANVTEKATLVASDGHIDLYGMQLANGTHSVTVSLRDGFGNETSQTRYFTVEGSSAENLVRVTNVETMAAVGGYVTLEIRGNSPVSGCDTVIRLDRQYTDCTVTFSQNFKAAERYDPANCYNAKDHTVTVKAVRAGGISVQDGNLIATVKVKVPDNLTASSTFLYEVRSGMCYNMYGELTTFSAPAVTLPVGAAISVSCDPVLTGRDAVLTVTDLEGKPVANAEIFGENGASLGKTGEDGTLTSHAFAAAGVITVYAQDTDGRLSMRYKVYTYDPVTVEKTAFLFNATENGGATKNITWLSDPTVTGKQFLRWRVQGTENWGTAIPAHTELRTFTGGGYKAVNVNSVTLGGLTAGTTYEYQAASGKENWPETAESFTAGTADASQKFFVLGDIQAEDTTNISNIFNTLKTGSYDFGIQTGDVVDSPTNFAKLDEMVQLLNAKELGSADMIHVLGNHEFEGDGNADITGSVFALPKHSMGSCWSTTYGNVYVAVINYSGVGSDMKTAAEWLVQDAQNSDATWKILTVHQPAYYTNATGGSAPMTQYIPAAAEAAGIDVVFSGHDHSFARTNPLKGGEIDAENGVYYYICGSSGEKSYSINSQNDFNYEKVFAKATTDFNAIYLSVEATRSQMKINVYDMQADGSPKLLDNVTLKSLTGSCADKGHVLENAVCSNGKLICGNCHAAVDPIEWNYTGWARDEATGRKMYFLRGVAQTGWFLVDEDNYCFDENGVAYDGEQVIDEVPFVFDNGRIVSGHTGFIKKTNGNTYYYDNGKMALGITEIGDDTYYFEPDKNSANYGAMVTGWRFIPGLGYGRCYFYEDGRMWRPIKTSLSDDSGMLTVTLTPMEGQTFANARIAMWSQQDGQDDLKWFRGEKQADETWVVEVPMCLYKDLWRYQIHAYDGSDLIAGTSINIVQTVTHKFTNYTVSTKNCVGAETKVAYCDYGCGTMDVIGWTEKDHTVTAVQDNNVLTVKMVDVASHGHTKVRFAVWSVENGQDDLAWYNAEKQADGNWTCTVDLTKHHSVGDYQLHAYASTGDSDTMRMAGHTTAPVTAFDDVKAPEVLAAVASDYNTMKITVRDAEAYEQISIPVWSEVNGQDDIKWYKAVKQADGSWTCTVDLAFHNSTGRYQIQVYGTKGDKSEVIAKTVVNVAKLPTTPAVPANVTLGSAKAVTGGIQVTWQAADGAAQYRVYRKDAANPKWKGIQNVTGTSWTDKTAVAGVKYTYTVRGINANGTLSPSFDSTGVSATMPGAAPAVPANVTLIGAKAVTGGIQVTWKAADGAAQYRVYRKDAANPKWKGIANVTGTSWTDKTAVAGVKYTYTVRGINANGTLSPSYDSTGVSATMPGAAPAVPANVTLIGAKAVTGGIQVTWKAADGAAQYRVYRKDAANPKWKGIANVTGTSWTDKTAVAGVKYTYTVRGINANGTLSPSYDSTGVSATMPGAAPAVPANVTLGSAKAVTGGIQVTWQAADGAAQYRVYRKDAANPKWKGIVNVTGTSWTDKTAKAGVKYTYTVRGINANGTLSPSYDSTGVSAVAK